MKYSIHLFILNCVFINLSNASLLKTDQFSTINRTSIIYGDDNRHKSTSYKNKYFRDLSKAVAVLIPNNNIDIFYFEKLAKIFGQEVRAKYNLCSDQRFINNPAPGTCSGFLVAPDILVTAGHCIKDLYDCNENSWVFNFNFNQIQRPSGFHTYADNIYKCVKILSHKYTFTEEDYAVLQLDRVVKNSVLLKIRKSGKIKNTEKLLMIGHPLGLPKVITDNGSILSNDKENYFVTDLDGFVMNSGSPVLNIKTGLVEGIFIRGGEDFQYDFPNSCNKVSFCQTNDSCTGEEVMRINKVKDLYRYSY